MDTPFLSPNPAASASPTATTPTPQWHSTRPATGATGQATNAAPLSTPPAPAATQLATGGNPLTELLASAPRQHALRLNPPTQPQTHPAAAQARHAHD